MDYILHIDGDAFFASCEIARRPDLKGKPVVVGEERGIACALTYEAKKLGVYRGKPIFQIRKEFPEVTVLSSHFDLYQDYNRNLLLILKKYLPVVEPYSVDECFALLPKIHEKDIEPFIKSLKKEVQESLGITYSFGIAPTKTLAKVASKKEKPDGCVFLLERGIIEETLKETPAGAIWGLGRQTSAALLGRNIRTAFEFIETPEDLLKRNFSEPVLETWHELRGEKIFEVRSEHEDQKSIQATRSLRATTDSFVLFSELSRNIETACEHLRAANLFTNSVHFFYRFADGAMSRKSAEARLPVYTQDPKVILREVKKAIPLVYLPGVRYKSTGITCLNLKRSEYLQDDLFGVQKKEDENVSVLKVIDVLNHKFGAWSVMRASSLKSVNERKREFGERSRKDTYEYGLPLPYMGEVY